MIPCQAQKVSIKIQQRLIIAYTKANTKAFGEGGGGGGGGGRAITGY